MSKSRPFNIRVLLLLFYYSQGDLITIYSIILSVILVLACQSATRKKQVSLKSVQFLFEPPRGKTNNVVSEQV